MADFTDDTGTIEDVTTDAAPAADLSVADRSEQAIPSVDDVPSTTIPEDDSAENPAKPFVDLEKPMDLYNAGGSGNKSADQISKERIAEMAVPGDWNIGGNGGGPLYRETAEEKKEREEREFFERMQEISEEQEKAAREFDEKMHKIGDHEYSGAHLHAMKEWLDDEKNADAFENELMQKHGISKDEAKKRRIPEQKKT